jgi:hypothetical protein
MSGLNVEILRLRFALAVRVHTGTYLERRQHQYNYTSIPTSVVNLSKLVNPI